MAQMTNKCADDEVEYYIKECGDILGVSSQINNPDDPKAILHYIFQEIVKYKSSSLSWSADSDGEAISNRVVARGNPVVAALDQRSNANSLVGGASAANSALANSDMGNDDIPDSDNSYAAL